jgi:hypothetical protein
MRALAVLAVLLGTARASAQTETSEPPVLASVGSGVGLGIVSVAVGGALLVGNERTPGRKAGAYTVLFGLALAPIASHAIALEWGRAAVFGGVGAAIAVGAVWLIESTPDLLIEGSLGKRRLLGLCYGLQLLSSGIGLFDSLGAGERARARGVALQPLLGRGELGVVVGGWL